MYKHLTPKKPDKPWIIIFSDDVGYHWDTNINLDNIMFIDYDFARDDMDYRISKISELINAGMHDLIPTNNTTSHINYLGNLDDEGE